MSPKTELRVAHLVDWACRPLNRLTLWAATVIVEERLRKAGILFDERGNRVE